MRLWVRQLVTTAPLRLYNLGIRRVRPPAAAHFILLDTWQGAIAQRPNR